MYHPDDPPMPCQGPDDDNDDKIRQQERPLVEAAEVLDRAPGCIVGPGPTAYVLHLNLTPICPFTCHGDGNDDDGWFRF